MILYKQKENTFCWHFSKSVTIFSFKIF